MNDRHIDALNSVQRYDLLPINYHNDLVERDMGDWVKLEDVARALDLYMDWVPLDEYKHRLQVVKHLKDYP